MLSLETGQDNDEVEKKIMKADTNGDGRISYTEFIKHFLQNISNKKSQFLGAKAPLEIASVSK